MKKILLVFMVLFLGFSTTGFGATASDLDKNSTEIEFDLDQSIEKVVTVISVNQDVLKVDFEIVSKAVLNVNYFYNDLLNTNNTFLLKENFDNNLFRREVYRSNLLCNYNKYCKENQSWQSFTNKLTGLARDKL